MAGLHSFLFHPMIVVNTQCDSAIKKATCIQFVQLINEANLAVSQMITDEGEARDKGQGTRDN